MIYPGSPDCTSSLCCCLLWITVYSSYFLSTTLVDACYFSWGLYTNTVPFLRFNQDPPCFWITNGLMHSQLIWFEIVVYFFFFFLHVFTECVTGHWNKNLYLGGHQLWRKPLQNLEILGCCYLRTWQLLLQVDLYVLICD